MYPRPHSMSQQQLGIPVYPDVTYRESPASLIFPGYRPAPNAPNFVQKSVSLPLQSPPPPISSSSPRPYYYYGGSNRSSTIDSQTGLDNPLNLSQDSGLSPSPLEPHHAVTHHFPSPQTGVYDSYNRSTELPISRVSSDTSSTKRWPFADFFRRNKKEQVPEEVPPPLPPKKRTNVFQPTMLVRPGNIRAERPASVPGFGSGRSWKHEREIAMLRVEAQRNSLVLSSDEEIEPVIFRRELSQQIIPEPQRSNEQLQQNATSYNRASVSDLCHIPEMREPFPAELDFSQITRQIDYDPRAPPPPPPRDPRRKSYLLQAQQQQQPSPQARPVSYSFENLPVHRLFRSPAPEPSDLGLPHPAQPYLQVQPLPVVPLRGIHKNFSNSEQQLSARFTPTEFAQNPSQIQNQQERGRFKVPPPRRGPRSVSLSNSNRVAAPYSSPSPVTASNLVNSHHSSGAESPAMLYQRSQPEYWKSPPPPFVPCPEPKYFSECLQNGSPMRPKQRWRNHSAEDPILLLQGKSSPSSGSLTSRDSGCSEPFVHQLHQQQQHVVSAATPTAEQQPQQVVLPVVVEKSESVERDVITDFEGDLTDSVVEPLRRSSPTPSSPCSSSPVRSGASQPGFSCRKRRSLFRDAMCELEDAIKVIQSDTDLLDRAERRDLPTAHQELIVRSRIEEALSKNKHLTPGDDTATTSLNTSAEMAFSDMDNFMNWNTSSSFENLEERALAPYTSTPLRQRTPSRRRSAVYDKKTDDMAYRICKANNRPAPSFANPAVISGQSYLLLSPEAAKTLLGSAQKPKIENSNEPDIITDDVHYRNVRDSLLQPKVLESQPKFGIPQGPVSGCGNDYLHSVPSGKYKSTFHAMKNPDTFTDDLAVRNLRKDDSRNTPDLLGIYKDRNVSFNSCWQHKLQERLRRRPSSPLVFIPTKNNKLMQALAEQISQTIRKQSGCPVGGTAEQIVTYDDLLRNKELMRAMKEALLQCTNEELEAEDQEKSTWSGKTIYELLRNGDPPRSRSLTRTDEHSSDVTPSPTIDVIVGLCLVEHDLTHFEKDHSVKNDGSKISHIIKDGSTSSLRAMERGDSGEEEKQLISKNSFSEKRKEERKRDLTNIGPETQVSPETQLSSQNLPEGQTQVPPAQDGAKSELSPKAQLSPTGDRKLVNSADGSSGDVRKSRRQNSRHRATRRHYDDISQESLEDGARMETSTASERRMAKYKEERRRQLASQIASRLSNACSSSSSDEQDEDNHRVGASGGESTGSGGGNGHSKYGRRHRSKRTGEKDGSLAPPGGSPSDKSGLKLVRRRRRRSLNGGTSPAPIPRSDKIPVVERLSAFLGDADGEDEGAEREDSPEHIYQRIDGDADYDVATRHSSKCDVTGDKVYHAVPFSPVTGAAAKRTVVASDAVKSEVGGATHRAYVTTHQPTRMPRKYSLPKTESATNPEVQGSMPAAGSSGSERLRAVREGSRTSSSQEKETTKKSTAALNTSYSSEELLFQAASSLQGLEEEFNSIHHSRHRPPSGGHVSSAAQQLTGNSLSSPEMIKTLSRNLTPPVSPFHHQLRFNSAASNGERKSPSAVHPQPDSEASSTVSSSGTSVPISDPLIDANWPGRPKRNGVTNTSSEQVSKLRRASPVTVPVRPRSSSRGSSETDLTINVAAASEAFQGPNSNSTPNSSTPGTSGKPPIFPSPERTPNAGTRTSHSELFQAYRPSEDIPAFVREFAARRRNNAASFNPNEPAPPPPTPTKRVKPANALAARPHSAFIPRLEGAHKKTSFELEPEVGSRSGPVPAARRRSDFLTRYENLMQRAQAAMQAVDSLDFETLSRREEGNTDEDDDNECVDFNEEEVLQRCQDFLKDYDKSKQRRSLDAGVVASPPVPKPRQSIGIHHSNNSSSITETAATAETHKPSLRTRSSSLTIHDKRSTPDEALHNETSVTDDHISVSQRSVRPKPILKKSSEDLKPIPILKNRFDTDSAIPTASSTSSSGSVAGGILKRKSVTDSGNETTASRPDHVRIRSPSPDLDGSDDDGEHPMSRRPILRSRKSSIGDDRASSPEYLQSILKRRSSQEDLDDGSAATSGATSRSSPEPPHSILKRKLSVGSLGSHSPEGSLIGGSSFSSILRKKSHSQHSSCQGSLEDLSCEGDKIRSILKKRSTVSTDDELVETLHDRPKSILKGRRSEESLSPLSDPSDVQPTPRMFRDPDAPSSIRPILKQRDSREEFSPVHETYAISRDKSSSPSRGAAISLPEPTEVNFSGSTGLTTPLRRASVPVSPRRQRASFADDSCEPQSAVIQAAAAETNEESVNSSSGRRASFVSKASVFIDSTSAGGEMRSPHRASRHSPISNPSSCQQSDNRNEGFDSSPEDRQCSSPVLGGGILRRQGSTNSRGSAKDEATVSDAETGSSNVVKKRSILKHDSLELISDVARLRGVLKKDSSYDETLRRPILKNNFEDSEDNKSQRSTKTAESSSNTSSSEDLDSLLGANRAFSGVVIDPVPSGVRKSSTFDDQEAEENPSSENSDNTDSEDLPPQPPSPQEIHQARRNSPVKSRKSSLVHPRQPVIPPSSVKIFAVGNLADQLECLADRAEAELKKIKSEQEENDKKFEIDERPPLSKPLRSAEKRLDQTKKEETINNNNNNNSNINNNNNSSSSNNNKPVEVKVNGAAAGQQFTAQDYYEIYRKSKEVDGNGSKKSKGVQRKSSFSSHSPPTEKEKGGGLNRSKSFSAYSIKNRRNPSPVELKGHERLSDIESEICDKVTMDIMLEQNNRRPPELKVTGGIAERLAALKRSGEEDWKKKISRQKKDEPSLVTIGTPTPTSANDHNDAKENDINIESTENHKNSERNERENEEVEIPTLRRGRGLANRLGTNLEGTTRPVSLVERLNQLQTSQSTWQSKVVEKDAEKYTVAGKMQKIVGKTNVTPRPHSMIVNPATSHTPVTSHLSRTVARGNISPTSASIPVDASDRIKKTPRPRRFQGSPPPPGENGSFEDNDDATHMTSQRHSSVTVDEGIENFFVSTSKRDEKLDCSIRDFDLLLPDDDVALVHIRKAGPKLPNRRLRGSINPIKHLSARTDLRQPDFDEVFEEELLKDQMVKQTPKPRDSVHSHLAAEALAGLAAKEDFSNVQLRKNNTSVPHQDMAPHKSGCMLLQVKGRRICQTRLVNPTSTSINSGDAYVLVTPKEIFNWIGQFSNVIERARSAEVAITILQKKDLGCKGARRVVTIEEEKTTQTNSSNKLFWKFLGCSVPPEKVNPPGPPEEDEDYEISINDLNLVWSVDLKTNELIPDEEFWGAAPKFELLEDMTRVLVFDFGSEVYVWNGRSAPFETRRLGIKLAKDLWEKGLEGTAPVEGHPLIPAGTVKRPDWAILGKVNQNMETILFREKFLNWPDKSRLIKPCKENVGKKKNVVLTSSSSDDHVKLSTDVERNFDIAEMVSWKLEEPNLELEMTLLGRGRSYYDEAERRQYEIETLSTKVWHVSEYDTIELDPKDFRAQFYFEDTYVVRWKYKVSLTGRDLKGQPSKHVAVGRERWAYFFWQGSQSGVTEKGASALMTVELDRERGPQIRVVQGREPGAFLNLWSGRMVVHLGRRGGEVQVATRARLYIVRGEVPEEAHCVEVDCKPESLRSRACFLYVDKSTIRLWIGHGAPDHCRKIAKTAAEHFKSTDASYHVVEENEGQESEDLSKFIGSRANYISMLPSIPDSNPDRSTRLYFMSSVSGDFQVKEVSCPFLSANVPNLMPFYQSDLYSVEQPAIFLIDVGGDCLWFWQGWWPDVGHDAGDTNLSTGSGLIRWHAERRVAMQTTLEYRDAKYLSRATPMKLVWAGHEPNELTNLFPAWVVREDAHQLNQKFLDDSNLESVLAALSKSTYTWEELQQRPLPDGVDPSKLEKYISDQDFKTHLGLSRQEFCAAPRWKQLEIRKEKGLF